MRSISGRTYRVPKGNKGSRWSTIHRLSYPQESIKKGEGSVAMTWTHYNKVYDLIMQTWIIELPSRLRLSNTPIASLQRGKISSNECPVYDIKPSHREVPFLELWEIWSTPSLSVLPCPLWSRVVAPDRFLSMGQIEIFDHLTVCKQMDDVLLNWCCFVRFVCLAYRPL